MRIKMGLVFLAVCPALLAQNAAQEPKVTKIVHVHGNAHIIAALAGHDRDASTIGDSNIKAVVIHARAAEAAEIEKAVLELDAISSDGGSSKDVEIVAYLVGGSMEAADSGTGTLAPVYQQLHAIFPFRSYQLLSTMLLRSDQQREASTSGMLKSLQTGQEATAAGTYSLHYDSASISADSSPVIHLAKLKFNAEIPVGSGLTKNKDGLYVMTNYRVADIGIETNVDVREGQKVVVGTSNVEPAGTTLFLVVTARLL